MSDNIPFELQEQIIKRLPVKSLIQYRSVSKAWKSLIDSSDFIIDHSLHHTQPDRLLVRYKQRNIRWTRYNSIVDDETFPRQKFVLSVPPVVEQLSGLRIVGSSHGLLCLYGRCKESDHCKVVLWNPSIRKSIAIFVPDALFWPYTIVVAFEVCPVNREPTVVKIVEQMIGKASKPGVVEVEVYTLSTGKWRRLSNNLPRNSIEVTWAHVGIDGFIYWFACDTVSIDGAFRSHNLILSFNMADESFEVIDLPSVLIGSPMYMITVSKLRESLAVVERRVVNMKQVCDVWVMDHGVQKTFTKLYTINASYASIRTTLGFRKNGEPIIEIKDHQGDPYGPTALGVYKHASEQINDLGIFGAKYLVVSYVETLFLLNR